MNPQELLYIVLAVCAIIVTGYILWVLSTVVRIIRQVRDMVDETRGRVHHLFDEIESLKGRFHFSAETVTSIVTGIAQVVDLVRERRTKRSSARGRKKTEG